MEYKTFEDLQFKPHYILEEGQHAKIMFENGYGVSVVLGDVFGNSTAAAYVYFSKLTALPDNAVCSHSLS